LRPTDHNFFFERVITSEVALKQTHSGNKSYRGPGFLGHRIE
jgi:hypothetical protein